MATITVTCPTCDCQLELDAAHRGQEVECGSCHQVFIATPARPDRKRSDRGPRDDRDDDEYDRPPPPRRRSSSRRRRYEDDDYDDDYYDRRRREETEGSGLGDASLILGVVAVFVFWCPIIGGPLTLVGLILGALGLRSSRNGTAIAGLILNILFLLASLLFMLIGFGGGWGR